MPRMRVVLVLASVIAAASATASSYIASDAQQTRVGGVLSDVPSCRSGFQYFGGWCVYTSNPTAYVYQEAVNSCASVNAYAPSVHNKSEIDFWADLITTLSLNGQHFWLDASCPHAGQPYVWRDGSPTDYYGPKAELQQCSVDYGYHIHTDGLETFIWSTPAPALCAYIAQPEPTNPPPSTTTAAMMPAPTLMDQTADYCVCNPYTIYLDIVFIVDTSADMTREIVGDATATIQSTLYGLTFGTEYFQSNVGAIAFADSVQTVRNFDGFKTVKDITSFSLPFLGGSPTRLRDAIDDASSMIASHGRNYTRGVIVLLTNSFNGLDARNISEASDSFKYDGGIFISIDYSTGFGIKDLELLASPGFYINDTSTNPQLDGDILYALCDANCFCRDGHYAFISQNDMGRELPNGCYHVSEFSSVYAAADENCISERGFVATVHDDDKNFFMISLFPTKARFWLGLQRNGTNFEWADGSNNFVSTYWAPGNPIAGQDCVYGQQQSGFSSSWFSAPCTDPLKNSMTYACQLRPCDSTYDCHD